MTRAQMELLFNVENADHDLATKSMSDIDKETAYTWAGRAVVAYRRFASTGKNKWLSDAAEYAHEAREHAAGVDDDGATLRLVVGSLNFEIATLGIAP